MSGSGESHLFTKRILIGAGGNAIMDKDLSTRQRHAIAIGGKAYRGMGAAARRARSGGRQATVEFVFFRTQNNGSSHQESCQHCNTSCERATNHHGTAPTRRSDVQRYDRSTVECCIARTHGWSQHSKGKSSMLEDSSSIRTKRQNQQPASFRCKSKQPHRSTYGHTQAAERWIGSAFGRQRSSQRSLC